MTKQTTKSKSKPFGDITDEMVAGLREAPNMMGYEYRKISVDGHAIAIVCRRVGHMYMFTVTGSIDDDAITWVEDHAKGN